VRLEFHHVKGGTALRDHPFSDQTPCCRIQVFELNTPRTGKAGPPELQPADSFLIRLYERERTLHLLIDAGKRGQGEQIILPYLKEEGITHLDYLIVSHPHNDHFGGVPDLLADPDLTVGRFIYAPVPDATVRSEAGEDANYRDWLEMRRLISGHPRIQEIVELDYRQVGERLEIAPSCYFDIVSLPDPGYYLPRDKVNLNNLSVVLKLNYHGFTALFTGDCGADQAEAILRSEQREWLRDVHVLKAAHHGGDESTNPEFIETCRAKIVLITCNVLVVNGRASFIQNLHLFSKDGAKIFRADWYTDIDLWTDGRSIKAYAKTERYSEEICMPV
jgi:competence protein ComEC